MNAEEFMRLPQRDQLGYTLEAGRELMHRIYLYYIVKLYLVEDFYIELWYRMNQNLIDKILVVDLDDVIHLYEKEIDISDLFGNGRMGK